MSKKTKQENTTVVTSEDHFMNFYNENNKKLVGKYTLVFSSIQLFFHTVVDIYPGWSGPCTAMMPTYK